MTAQVRIVPARWPEDAEALRAVRRPVFVVEQGVEETLEWDGRDAEADHLLALDEGQRPLGTVRLERDGKIGRMAVLAPRRGTGIGSRLLRGALARARERGLERVYLHAQEHALTFYHRHGFVSEGPRFLEAGIPHYHMSRPSRESYRMPVAEPETARRVLRLLADAARRNFALASRRASAPTYTDRYLADALTALARRESDLPIRLFVLDPDPQQPLPAALRTLVHALPSRAAARAPAEDVRPENVRPLALADDLHCFLFEDEDEGRGVFSWSDPTAARAQREKFDALWEAGETPAFFRRLDL